MKLGTATTTTHAPPVNLVKRKITVAVPVTERAEPVDGGTQPPARRPQLAPMDDQTRLRQRESGEDADGEQRDEGVGVPAHGHQQRPGEDGQHEDPVGEHLAVAAQREEVREVAVPSQQAGQDGQTLEGGVGGQRQHEGDRHRHHEVRPVPADRHPHDLAQHGVTGTGGHVEAPDQDREAEQHEAEDHPDQRLKREAGQAGTLEALEGAALLATATPPNAEAECVIARHRDDFVRSGDAQTLLSEELAAAMAQSEARYDLTRSQLMPLVVDRPLARAGAWYEMMPRSQGAMPGRHGTFADCIARVPDIAALGFDVLYLTPIHPIGRTNRKGRNNAVRAARGDPGSPYAIGSPEGGHDAIHPELGTLDDFRRLIAATGYYYARVSTMVGLPMNLPSVWWQAPVPTWERWPLQVDTG